ncbi:MAG: metallophosphoesterase [Verrucomicrobiales bacterium]
MRTIAIGDIHGCRASLETLARFANFGSGDTIITLGDVVNRGPDSKGVIEVLLNLSRTSKLIPLKGNHEIMLLQVELVLGDQRDSAGDGDFRMESIKAMPEAHVAFIRSFLPYHETSTHIFVHASVLPEIPMDAQTEFTLFWEEFANRGPHVSGKTVVCGHTPQLSGEPLDFGHSVCIDTFAHGGGWLTALDVDRRIYWQANEARDTRMDVLEPLPE